MKKRKFTFSDDGQKYREVKVAGETVKVKPFLSLKEQVGLIETYINTFFFSKDEDKIIEGISSDFLGAEFSLTLGILDMCTNIDVAELDLEDVVRYDIGNLIYPDIDNYLQFRDNLDAVVRTVERDIKLQKSIGGVLDFMFTRVLSILQEFSELETPDMDKLIEQISKLGKQLEESRLRGLMDKQ